MANSANQDQTPQVAASYLGFHCLPAECYIEIRINMKNTIQHPFKQKWTVDNGGKFHSALNNGLNSQVLFYLYPNNFIDSISLYM